MFHLILVGDRWYSWVSPKLCLSIVASQFEEEEVWMGKVSECKGLNEVDKVSEEWGKNSEGRFQEVLRHSSYLGSR